MIPRVSLLMTAYNRARYLPAAIESVLAQTYADFELIIVDDCSSDDTVEIAQSYARLDSRIRVSRNPANLGDYANRNHAASLARGEYLKFQDSDDCLYPHGLAVMFALLQSEPRAALALSGHRAWSGGPCPMLSSPELSYQREFLGEGLFHLGPAGALFRTRFFQESGGFTNIGVASDYFFWLKICARCNVLLLPADLFWYRIHAGQELSSPKAAREYALTPRHAWEALASPDCPLKGNDLETARRNLVFSVAKMTKADLASGRFALAAYRLRRFGLGPAGWGRYLRRPRRHSLRGVSLNPQGDFIMPDWSQYRVNQ